MFNIVSMQDILVNLNGSETLFKQFDRPRSRKRSTTIKSSKERTPSFDVQNIWILPGHILMLSDESENELIAYDQLPKIGPYGNTQKNLLASVSDNSGVLDIFYDFVKYQYVFIVMKSGTMVVWFFLKSMYEWKHVSTSSLCKGRGCQLTSFVYNEHRKVLVWIEKRSSSQFCVCTASITFTDKGDEMTISSTRGLLHNCLPMSMRMLSKDMLCFLPSSPPGLMLFWSLQTDAVNVHVWGENFNKQSIPATSSDFQSIVTSSISLWINSYNNDTRLISTATHPATKELVVLQNDLQVYLIRSVGQNSIESLFLSNLEVENERDSFAKLVLKFNLVQRLVVVITMDGIINIFDVRGGLFLWKSTTFKSNSPNIWICKGLYSTFGVWNRSGIWNLRMRPIADQIQEFHSSRHPESNESIASQQNVPDVEFAIDVFEEQKKLQKNKPKRRIKQGVNRSSELPIHYLLKILTQWKLTNVSTEMALAMSLKTKHLLNDDSIDEDVDLTEISYLLEEIKDPILLLVLFTDRNFPFSVKKQLIHKLQQIIESPTSKNIDQNIHKIIKEYIQIDKEIQTVLMTEVMHEVKLSTDSIINKEFTQLQELIKGGSVNVKNLDACLVCMFELNQNSLMCHLLPAILSKNDLKNTVYDSDYAFGKEFCATIWKIVLRINSSMLDHICIMLWVHSPSLLVCLLKEAKHVLENVLESTKDVIQLNTLILHLLQLIHLPKETSDILLNDDLLERINTYCSCLKICDLENSEEEAYDIYIRYQLIEKATEILQRYNDNSQKHYSMFSKLFVSLISNKTIGKYVEMLKDVIPEKFNMAEINIILCNQSIEVGGGPVFSKSPNDLCIEMLKPMFDIMLS